MKQMIEIFGRGHLIAIGCLSLGLAIGTAVAQDNSGLKQPTRSMPDTSIPGKIAPPDKAIPAPPETIGRGGEESLTDKLKRGDGVITPPPGIDPELRVPAPVPDADPTIVIPPPGSPGNPSSGRPK